MAISPLLLQTAGSLVAILALAGFARWLKLGGAPMLDSEDAVHRAAAEVDDGFTPSAIARAADGTTALASDAQGRVMVIKRHGNRFAGRVLGPAARAIVWRDQGASALEVDCGEARFGKVFLDLPDADAWGEAINALNERRDV